MRVFNKDITAPAFKIGQQSKKEFNASLLLVVVFIMTVGLGLFLIKPKIQDDIEITKQVSELGKRWTSLNNKAEMLKKLDEEDLREKVNKAVKSLPIKKEIPQVIASVERLVRSNNLDPNSISIDSGKISTESAQQEVKTAAEILKVNLGISGSYDNLKNFLAKLLSVNRLLTLENFSIKSTGENDFSSSVALSYYYQALLSKPQDVEAPVELLTNEEKDILDEVSNYEYISEPFMASPSSRINPFVDF